jgi:monoamine oxidase
LNEKKYEKLSFVFSKESIPTWWTQYPGKSATITGWSGGPHAEKLKGLSKEQILSKGLDSLSKIFSVDIVHLQQQLKGWHVADWMDDPYCLGAYSYDVVNGIEYKEVLRTPVENTIYFAGEGLYDGPEIGTVEAAFVSGRDTAHKIIAGLKIKPEATKYTKP